MCGIAGWVDFGRELVHERETVEAMAKTLACRGPDDEGSWVSSHAAFAHRRLAVIDVAGGRQPMVRELREEEPFVLTYAGEVYNFRELRAELADLGHAFETRSDTEVLLRAYMQWGPSCVDRLNGMFAFGIWDGRREELFLARDRLGIKPLFYALRGDGILFGSEPKALLAHPLVDAEVSDEGLAEVFGMGFARTPGRAVYHGMEELRAGFALRFDRKGAHVSRYWQLVSRPHEDGVEATAKKIRALLEDIVARQLVSDVPICCLLSGGLDSSAVTALAAEQLRRSGRGPVETWSVDFAGSAEHFQASDLHTGLDGPFIRRMVEWVSARHHDVVLDTPQLLASFFAPLVARDLPSMGEMDVSLYLLFKAIKREATVAVSGESADEVFGGYPWFNSEEALSRDAFPWVTSDLHDVLSPELARRLRPAEYVAARYREALAEVPSLPGESPRDARMRAMYYLNLSRFLPILLDRKDRMSMAVGLEVRVPFCDHRLVEYVWNVPWELKRYGGREKGILRLALEGALPREVLERKKSAYPTFQNPEYLAAMRSLLARVLDDPSSRLAPLVDVPKLRGMLSDEQPKGPEATGIGGRAHLFGYLVQVDEWLRRYGVAIR